MLQYFYFVLFVIIKSLVFVHCETIYNVVAPGTIRPNFDYTIAVSIHQADGPFEMELGLYASNYNNSKLISVLPMSTEIVKFQIPKLDIHTIQLRVTGITDTTINNSTNLNYQEYKPIILIQTDKKIYKPGDTVHFRVLFLDEKTQPAVLQNPIKILIRDHDFNVIKVINDVNPVYGVFNDSLQLSEEPVLGGWLIFVYDGDSSAESKSFTVRKYELPTFSVFIDVPEKVTLDEEVIGISTWARYSFGKPVKGKATVTLTDSIHYIDKTISTASKGYIEFNIKNELPIDELLTNHYSSKYFYVRVIFEEALTGNMENITSQFELLKENVVFDVIKQPDSPKIGELLHYIIALKKMNGSPVQDDENFVELHLTDNHLMEYSYYSALNGKGIARFTFPMPDFQNASVRCKYLNTQKFLNTIFMGSPPMNNSKVTDELELEKKTMIPKLGSPLTIMVNWTEPIEYFVYIVTARGKIIFAEHVEVAAYKGSYLLEINPTFDMMPKSSILVQYIYENNLRFKEMTVYFERALENTLNITTTAQANPGDDIEFQITTNPNSLVGILAVDQRVLYLERGNDFSIDDIFSHFFMYDTQTPTIGGVGRYPGEVSGLVTLTNANFPYSFSQRSYASGGGYSGGYGGGSSGSYPYVREKFPETWIYENFITTNDGTLNFVRTIPDTITSWIITGFAINLNTSIALTMDPTKIQVFKPFFISMNLPYSVKQGEVISVPVLIFNYMNETIDVEVSMDNTDEEFEFVNASSNDNNEQVTDKTKLYKRATVPADDVFSLSFMMRPKMFGMLTLKVTAISPLAGDALHRKLRVEPEGITQYANRAILINLNSQEEQKETINLDVPENIVPHTEHIEFSAVGDLVGLNIKYLDNLVRIPFGYGEQNMINFVPSVLILKYLQTINRNLPNVTTNARNILKIGYQLELRYKRTDGSFSAYGNSDKSGSTWLTAYVARYFQMASKFIDIDEEVIKYALNYLAMKQTSNGNFAEFGHLSAFPHMNDIAHSAFVLLAFLENKENAQTYNINIQKGLQFLLKSTEDTDDMHALSITAYILQITKHPLADDILNRLKALAKTENGLTWWTSNNNNDEKKQRQKYSRIPSSSDIEITSYVALAMLEKGANEDVLPIIKWLTMQRNSNGGFISTQDTVIGLEALIKFAEKIGYNHAGEMDIDYICIGAEIADKGKLKINTENSMILMSHELPRETRQLEFTAKGNRSTLLQLSYNYNTIDKESDSDFKLNVTIRRHMTFLKKRLVVVCAEFVPKPNDIENDETNMVVLEVSLPSGFTITSDELEKLRDFNTILFTETKKSNSLAIIYLRSLKLGQRKCVPVVATRTHDVAEQKPASVVIYDYNNKDRKATEFYEINTSLCDICEAEECGADCK